MLPPFIIEQIRKREKEEREHQAEQPRLELPLERRRWSHLRSRITGDALMSYIAVQ